jgi:hypothetical protein
MPQTDPTSLEYILAWTVYALSGIGCTWVWWKLTAGIGNRGWQDLLRGLVMVLIFTPWFTGDDIRIYAPAFLILSMDVLLEGAKSDLHGGVALMFSSFFMLSVLSIRIYFYRRPQRV